jgi:hypothetical protein
VQAHHNVDFFYQVGHDLTTSTENRQYTSFFLKDQMLPKQLSHQSSKRQINTKFAQK